MHTNPHAITVALDLYFKGVSLRKIVDHLKQFEGVTVSHVAVIKWIKKYVALMRDYVDAPPAGRENLGPSAQSKDQPKLLIRKTLVGCRII